MHTPALFRRPALPCLGAFMALALALPAQAAVGSGTAASCTEAALDLALAGGGAVSFDCGPDPVTIPITSTKVLTEVVHIDGGNLVTLQGNGSVRLFDLSGPVNYIMANLVLRDGMALNGNGGAIRIETSTLLLSNVTLSGNTATGMYSRGGAIYSLSGAEVTLQRVTATGNTAQYGGAIYTGGATDRLTLTEVIAQGNSSVVDGGAILHTGVALNIAQSLFIGNQSSTYGAGGGAIIVSPDSTSTLTIANSTFHNNLRSGGGGNGSAISVLNGVAAGAIVNSTFADNGGSPGTIAVSGNSQLTLTNTIVSNTMGQPNCAVFGTAGAAIVDGGRNLQWGGSVPQSCGTGIPVVDPQLAPLADNGGFSQTLALQAGSPAINAGSGCAAVDQRGVARPIGPACDIGAFESPLGSAGDGPAAAPTAVPTLGHAGLALLSAALAGAGALRRRRITPRK
ncbi:MAG: IPTL-CTERM sorting domain-containing protein [Ottowia sp.]|uniref:IPTL-CTERM sorting domain-containing protein n=1 Tax=Ottowia sp. TaxID=1898956 RepID=UPI0039E4E783